MTASLTKGVEALCYHRQNLDFHWEDRDFLRLNSIPLRISNEKRH